MKYNEFGEEVPDTTPIEIPLKFKRPPTLQEQIKAMVRREFSEVAAQQGFETFAEADDFDVGDDEPLPPSNYEFKDMPIDGLFHSAKPDASRLDKNVEKEDDTHTVNKDRTKESSNVQHSRVDDHREGVGSGGEERAASGGSGRPAGSGGK